MSHLTKFINMGIPNFSKKKQLSCEELIVKELFVSEQGEALDVDANNLCYAQCCSSRLV